MVDYSRGDQSADDRIVEIVAGLGEDASVLVVSSDREVRDAVSALGADVTRAGAFLAAVDAWLSHSFRPGALCQQPDSQSGGGRRFG